MTTLPAPSRFSANYKPSPPVNRTYTGSAVPTAYDPNWQLYNNLTKDQIAWFQAQPDWQQFIDWTALSPTTATINAAVSLATIETAISLGKKSL